jgi:hypothetical protein
VLLKVITDECSGYNFIHPKTVEDWHLRVQAAKRVVVNECMLGPFTSDKLVEVSCIGKENRIKYILFYICPQESPISGHLLVGNQTLGQYPNFFLDSPSATPSHIIVPKRTTVS